MAQIPERIGKYEVIRRLGYGGMGAVYLARDPDLDRMLAIKVLREMMFEDEVIHRFLREARAAGNLRHENVITVYDAGEHDHQPFMAMEYVDGVSLAEMIRLRQPLALADKLSYLEQICSGLYYAHGQGIVHRDIKPANLMVDRRNVVRILDFGIARVEGSGMTRDGALIGTLNYMSPEQMLGRAIDHRSDVFAFGAVAYELLAYEKAFPGTIQDGLLQRLPNEPPKPLSDLCPGLPDELEPMVMRALAKLPQDRFADLEEARGVLRHIRRHLDPHLDLEPIAAPRRAGAGVSSTPVPGSASERGDRLGSVHRYIAEADLRLSQGELESADGLVRQALRLDPGNTAALTLRSRIEQAATSQGIVLPTMILPRAKDQTPPPEAVAAPESVRPATTRGSRPDLATPATPERLQPSSFPVQRIALIGAIVAAAIVGGFLWISSLDNRPASPEPAATARVEQPAAAPDPTPVPPVVRPDPAPPAAGATDRSLQDQLRDQLQDQLSRISAAHKRGDLEGALAEIGPALSTNDERARTLARTLALDARRTMTAAAAAARTQKAADQSPRSFASAERARGLSERAFERGDFVEAGTQALLASANYALAEREAAAASARPVTPAQPTARVPEGEPTRPPSIVPAPPSAAAAGAVNPAPVNPVPAAPSPVTAAPPPAAAPTSAATAAAPPAAASAIEIERAGIMRALNRYQDAYRNRSIKDLEVVYPSLSLRPQREERQALDESFRRNCRGVDFIFVNPQFNFNADDPTAATVTARTTFTCQPGTGQKEQVASGNQVFILRKAGDSWLIDRIITDPATR